ncbi:MAG TPA: hypothetical protein VGS20_06590 [Candidatus Acidoferrales bacterium]|nr:hypothetical protein [Candidatus Acidoferrales bacterium]
MTDETLLKVWTAMELIGEAHEECRGRRTVVAILASIEATLMLALIAAAEAAQAIPIAT